MPIENISLEKKPLGRFELPPSFNKAGPKQIQCSIKPHDKKMHDKKKTNKPLGRFELPTC